MKKQQSLRPGYQKYAKFLNRASSEGQNTTDIKKRRLDMVGLGSLKWWSQVQRQGMKAMQDECVIEV